MAHRERKIAKIETFLGKKGRKKISGICGILYNN